MDDLTASVNGLQNSHSDDLALVRKEIDTQSAKALQSGDCHHRFEYFKKHVVQK